MKLARKIIEVQHGGKAYKVTVIGARVASIVLPYTRAQRLSSGAIHSAYCEREVDTQSKTFAAIAAKVAA